MKIAVLFGGSSSEKEVSMSTGISIINVLQKQYEVFPLNWSGNIKDLGSQLYDVDLVFNALHGGDGENGTVQTYFESHNIPYTGSDSKASMLAMDKHLTKLVAQSANILTPKWILLKWNNYQKDKVELLNEDSGKFNYPFIVKPSNEGSTIGVTLVKEKTSVDEAIILASNFSNNIIIEEYIDGREITVGILGNKALPVIEIIPKSGFYDYNSKYKDNKCLYKELDDIDSSVIRKIQDDSIKIYKNLNCRHYARVDYILDKKGNYYFLEINTLPGMTSTSLIPKAAKIANLNFDKLINTIVNIAIIDQ